MITLRRENEVNCRAIGKFEALWDQNDKRWGKYIKISQSDNTAFFKVVYYDLGNGEMFISQAALTGLPLSSLVDDPSDSPWLPFLWHKIKKSQSLKLSTVGLVITFLGFIADVTYAFTEESRNWIELRPAFTNLLYIFSWAAKIGGVLIVYCKAVADAKD